ncbi:adenosylcobinamide-phosphate synthase CbiB [Peribacillus tepidiphilus]|uniref:adenosylcobinamide-phosphate synthase CbiB n=1 Tax=Peribacillus tepidiphilus TaxID=2652445 RepID=UPI0035B4FCF5
MKVLFLDKPEFYIILLSILLDLVMGDPKWLPHPVLLFGRIISLYENKWNKGSLKVLKGSILAFLLPLFVLVSSYYLLKALYFVSPILSMIIEIYWISTTIAVKGLRDAAMDVFRPLQTGNLREARIKLSYIVGRDTDSLPPNEVARGAIETVAENTVDAIISPLFFAIIGGAPLALAYRTVNTLDSMVGYKNDRYKDFGWASARLDDVLNWIPARICVACMWIGSLFQRNLHSNQAIQIVIRDAKKHPSPNSGYPEAMTAGLLGIQLGGTNTYNGMISKRPKLGDGKVALHPNHIVHTIKIMHCTWFIFFILYFLIDCVFQYVS